MISPAHCFLKKCLFFILTVCFLLTGCGKDTRSPVAMLSVSSDGRYVLSTHYGRFLILWDIQQRSKKILSKQASIFSPYFIPETHHFLWQDAKDKQVYVQSVDGKVLKSFNPGFPVYGHVMTTDLKHYVASSDNWSLYRLEHDKMVRFKNTFSRTVGSARLLKLVLKGNSLLTAGDLGVAGDDFPIGLGHTARDVNPEIPERINRSLLNGVVLWDITSGTPVKKFLGNAVKTVADLSPFSRYVVGGDEGLGLFLWETKTGKRLYLMDLPTNPKTPCYHQKLCLKKTCGADEKHKSHSGGFLRSSLGEWGTNRCCEVC